MTVQGLRMEITDPGKVDCWEWGVCMCACVCVRERETPAIAEVAASSRAKKSQIAVAEAQRSEADPGLLQYHEQLPSLSWHVGEIRGPRSSLLPN